MCQGAEVVVEGLDDGGIWQKRRLSAMPIGWLEISDVALGDTTFEYLVVVAAVAIDIDTTIGRQGVHSRHTHAVEPRGYFIPGPTKFATGMQHRHHDLERANAHFGVDTDRDTLAIIAHRDRTIIVDDDFDGGCTASHDFVDRIVDDFAHHGV